MKLPRNPKTWAVLLIGGLLSAEVALRVLGTVDFPLYDADNQIGYIPSANQHGSFLNKNDWEFNSLHMGAPAFMPNPKTDILLIGDSVVYGGNSYRKYERLGPALQSLTQGRGQVWPISAGSWALRNELAWLRLNPEVADHINRIVFVLNTGDFDRASSWSCEFTHPRTKPLSAIWYLFNKYVDEIEQCGEPPANLRVPDGDLSAELRSFLSKYKSKAIFILYPDKSEVQDAKLRALKFQQGVSLLVNCGAARIVPVSDDPRWQSRWYKDGIHPTADGMRVLAQIVADTLPQ